MKIIKVILNKYIKILLHASLLLYTVLYIAYTFKLSKDQALRCVLIVLTVSGLASRAKVR